MQRSLGEALNNSPRRTVEEEAVWMLTIVRNEPLSLPATSTHILKCPATAVDLQTG